MSIFPLLLPSSLPRSVSSQSGPYSELAALYFSQPFLPFHLCRLLHSLFVSRAHRLSQLDSDIWIVTGGLKVSQSKIMDTILFLSAHPTHDTPCAFIVLSRWRSFSLSLFLCLYVYIFLFLFHSFIKLKVFRPVTKCSVAPRRLCFLKRPSSDPRANWSIFV